MKMRSFLLSNALLLAALGTAHAKTIVVNTVDNTNFSPGQTNLVYALQILADGDVINFAIPGAGVHTIDTPADGYPLITKNNIVIDGYSQQQAGSTASPNTASIHDTNNAQIKICLSSENGNALSMYSAVTNFAGIDYPNLGFGDSEQAVLGFFRATNVWVKGLAFLAAPQTSTSYAAGGDCKTICFAVDAPDVSSLACQGFHVSGCWFGVDPATGQTAYMPDGVTVATPAICIATYGTGTNGTPGFPNIETEPGPGTIGVAAGSANPRAEFNVFVTGYGFDSQGGPFRICGNFWNVLPDGTTLADISTLNGGSQQGDAYVEFGSGQGILIGTDGDGVNDAEEGNLFGAYQNGGIDAYYYGSQGQTIMAGNSFGVDIHGNSFNVGKLTRIIHHLNTAATCQLRFGSDFNGVSDALEANTVVDSLLFDLDNAPAPNSHWVCMRGNSLVNSSTPLGTTPPVGDGQLLGGDGEPLYSAFIDISGPNGTLDIIPTIGAGTSTTTLMGTCGKRLTPDIRVVLDLYEADTTPSVPAQGKRWLGRFAENSAADSNPTEGAYTFDITSLGIAHGTAITLTATYIVDPPVAVLASHVGGNTTLRITGGAPPYDIYGATTITGSYALVASTASNTATFAAPTNMSFYKIVYHPQMTSGVGQTSPFAAVYTMP